MILSDKETVFAECDELGEVTVRAKLEAGNFDRFSEFHREWLHQKAEERFRQEVAEERERAERAILAAERSALATQQAALAASGAARWAMWAVIIAVTSLLTQYLTR